VKEPKCLVIVEVTRSTTRIKLATGLLRVEGWVWAYQCAQGCRAGPRSFPSVPAFGDKIKLSVL